ncbi:GAF and ANTAR domain-containing protein [Kocuria sp. SM24M-10]|uniref:GAF and ANTAR domain-containing protein n=1 Tax=Kocuria sp. SM24M-10 TaxID=1660349 RepID=UPI00069AE243|nr:GAF and ANTAR domain-containing protein [Kocuria sp. SM24M-10]
METDSPMVELSMVFARLSGMLLSEDGAAGAARRLAEAACVLVDDATGAGVSLLDEAGRRRTTGSTGGSVDAADALQYELGEGPCLSAWATGAAQRVEDTTEDRRWPAWSAAAAGEGIRSVLSVPLVRQEHEHALGAMKVYAAAPHAFSAREEQVLGLLAGAAATLLGSALAPDAPNRLSASLRAALADRRAVDLATGMLMERHGTDAQGARATLLHASRALDLPLTRIASRVLERAPDPQL